MVRQWDQKGHLSFELGRVYLVLIAAILSGVEVGQWEEAESALKVQNVDIVLAPQITVDQMLCSPVVFGR